MTSGITPRQKSLEQKLLTQENNVKDVIIMKYRQGFVSNSSTTSFCIFGVCLDNAEFEELLKIPEEQSEHEDYDFYEVLDNWGSSELPDGFIFEEHDENVFIGRKFTTILDHETGEQFKEHTKAVLMTALPGLTSEQFSIHEEAFADY